MTTKKTDSFRRLLQKTIAVMNRLFMEKKNVGSFLSILPERKISSSFNNNSKELTGNTADFFSHFTDGTSLSSCEEEQLQTQMTSGDVVYWQELI